MSTHADLLSRHRLLLPSWHSLYYREPIALVDGDGCRVRDAEGNEYPPCPMFALRIEPKPDELPVRSKRQAMSTECRPPKGTRREMDAQWPLAHPQKTDGTQQ